jgi:transposase
VTQRLLWELLGLKLSLGTVSRVEASVSAALTAAYAEVVAAVAAAPVANYDETPWRSPGSKPWLWTGVTPEVSLYHIADRRNAEAFAALVTARPDQVKGTDRFIVYVQGIATAFHQYCWAHLDREFRAWAGRAGKAGLIGRALWEKAGELFDHWHAFRAGTLDRETLAARLAPVQTGLRAWLVSGAESRIPKLVGLCENLLSGWEALWTFVRVPGVEPTNNAAERALRQAVLWRKLSLFTQSLRGREYVERLLTVKDTLRKRRGDLLEFLTESLRAARLGTAPPQLLASAPT